MKNRKPWLSEKGTPLSEKELKDVSKNWNPETWEAYLQTIEVEQKDVLIGNIDDIEDLASCLYHELLPEHTEVDPRIANLVEQAVNKLKPKIKNIFIEHYWNEKSERTLVRELGITRDEIRWAKRIGKQQIKKFLESKINKLGRVESQNISENTPHFQLLIGEVGEDDV